VTRYGIDGEVLGTYQTLSIYIETEDIGEEKLQMQVTSPSGQNIWNFSATRKAVEGEILFGSSSLALGDGTHFENGIWHLLVMRKDGRSLEKDFVVQKRPIEAGGNLLTVTFDKKTGTLGITGQENESEQSYAISLLSKTEAVIFEGEMQGTSLDVKKLTQKWSQTSSVMVGYYDASANMSIVGWYSF
jgi:hypothetical protein